MRKFASLLVMLILFHVLALGQDRTITGVIKDEGGLVVPGAGRVRRLIRGRIPARRQRHEHHDDNRSRPHTRGGFDLG